jgi:hypothetical protein
MLMEEIGWCVWTAACSFKRTQMHEPFYQNVDKPEGSLLSSIYNTFGIGSTKTTDQQKKKENIGNQKLKKDFK